MAYRIEYSPDTIMHLRALTARAKSIIFDAIAEQLIDEPKTETRNRKPMRPNQLAPWELRVGNLRVYYDVIEKIKLVIILAVGVKERNHIRIGKEIVEL